MTWVAKGACVPALAVIISGCDGISSNDPSGRGVAADQLVVVLSGRAAVGAPIANALVDARCEDGGHFIEEVQTDSSGGFTGQVDATALPCALRVSAGAEFDVLHSYTSSAGTVNVTPFTDLIITLATSGTPEIWFQQDDYASVTNNLDQAKNEFLQALTQAGYRVPADFDPFHSSFQINDTIDKLLHAFFEAVRNLPNVASYGEFVDLISSGNLTAIPSAPQPPDSGDGSSGDGGDGSNDDSADGTDDGSSDGSGKGNGRGNGSNKGSGDGDNGE